MARALCHPLSDRGEQQQLLPAAVTGDVRRLAGANPGRLCHGGQGQPVSDSRASTARPGRASGPAARRGGGAGAQLGPVLLQLPPTLKADPDTLDACLKEFRTAAAALGEHGVRLAVEPRHETWWTDEIRHILAAHDATLCWADRHGRPITPLWR